MMVLVGTFVVIVREPWPVSLVCEAVRLIEFTMFTADGGS